MGRQKFPRLEAMRLARDVREKQAAAPVQHLLDLTRQELYSVSEGQKALQRVVMTDFGKHLLEEIHHCASRDMYPEMARVMASKPGEPVTITVTSETMRFLRPSEFEKKILDRAAYELEKRARVSARKHQSECSTVVTVTFPSFSIQTSVVDEALYAPKRRSA